MEQMKAEDKDGAAEMPADYNNGNEDDDDGGPSSGTLSGTLSEVKLAAKSESRYPRKLHNLAEFIHQPKFPLALHQFLFILNHRDQQPPVKLEDLPSFNGEIKVYHSATAIYYAPSNLCGAGGLCCEHICSTPSFHGHERRDTMFVVLDESKHGMEGMEIGRVLLFFSFRYRQQNMLCALINWFVHDEEPD
ncbi:hypothetical protein BYT27DRAFT_7217678 [Phlegmacium glaucopus]|nr:hypothetical protein BYT27DRAFT_7217678 [Phlegmacium glaucopus]